MKETDDSRRPERLSPESLVEKAAFDAGFSLAGVSGISPVPRAESAFERWITGGLHGEMRYLAHQAAKRNDPRLLLEGARSVVCVAVDYYSSEKEQRNRAARTEGRGEVALYAQGRDYHDVVREMLAGLEGRLRALFPGVRTRGFVDAGPVGERALALGAGIGWLGKNTCVISPRYGSWIFLGEIVTDLALEPGSPLETLCGDCRKCIDACPTGALDAFVLDARKCISYLTIEKRGEIPEVFHRAIGDRLFGCDECQRVCPFHALARESTVFGAAERNLLVDTKVDVLVDIADENFHALARGTAMRRCGPEGMRRNARIVAGNRR